MAVAGKTRSGADWNAKLSLEGIPEPEAEEFFVYQYLFVATPNSCGGEPAERTASKLPQRVTASDVSTATTPRTSVKKSSVAAEPAASRTLSILYVANFHAAGVVGSFGWAVCVFSDGLSEVRGQVFAA